MLFIKTSILRIFTNSLVLFSLIFVNGCSKQHQIKTKLELKKEDWIKLEKFFRFFFLQENAIYTLCGSKPITEIYIDFPKKALHELTESNMKQFVYYEINKSDRKHVSFYKNLPQSEKDKAILISGKNYIANTDELWEHWVKISHQLLSSKKYMFVKRDVTDPKFLENSKKAYQIYFVNIAQTAITLEENYEIFKKTIGFDFDPFEVTLQFQDQTSKFWSTVKTLKQSDAVLLWGLFFGYGKENAIYYQWRSKALANTLSGSAKSFINSLKHTPSNKKLVHETDRNAFTIQKFPIPYFISFSENDPIIKKYEKERRQIQKNYRGKDFVDTTLELLIQ